LIQSGATLWPPGREATAAATSRDFAQARGD
jgi:hypothetical protein